MLQTSVRNILFVRFGKCMCTIPKEPFREQRDLTLCYHHETFADILLFHEPTSIQSLQLIVMHLTPFISPHTTNKRAEHKSSFLPTAISMSKFSFAFVPSTNKFSLIDTAVLVGNARCAIQEISMHKFPLIVVATRQGYLSPAIKLFIDDGTLDA